MIIDRLESHFIFILPKDHVYFGYNYINYLGKPLTNKEYLQYWGKWIVLEKRDMLDEFAKKLDPLVENREIPGVKYDRERIEEFHLGECVMCVYCDFRQREDVWKYLDEIGVKVKAWVFEKETMERWLPGGHLLEKWIKGQDVDNEKAEKIREGAKEKFRKMFENEDAIFTGINQ
jgi:hypothetical protein